MKQFTIPRHPHGYPEPPPLTTAMLRLLLSSCYDPASTAAVLDTLGVLPPDDRELWVKHYTSIMHWQSYGFTTLFPSSEILTAATHTDVLDCIEATDLHPAWDSCLICLPSTHTISVPPLYSNHILLSHFTAPSLSVNTADGTSLFSLDMPSAPFLQVNILWSDGESQSASFPISKHEPLHQILTESALPSNRIGTLAAAFEPPDHLEAQFNALSTTIALVCNLLLIAQSYPIYVQPHITKHRPPNSSRAVKPPSYRMLLPSRTISPSTARPHTTTSHHTVTPHQRRGHWRRQPHGSRYESLNPSATVVFDHAGRSCHMIWLPPTFVLPSTP